jgi:hypothetical protein
LRNDFNQQWLETARIATLSQQIALRGPNGIFAGDRNPPTMLRRGGRDAERHRTPKLTYILQLLSYILQLLYVWENDGGKPLTTSTSRR